jgi:hypothetical protein
MAILTEAQKKAVPKSERGVPSKSGTGSYPLTDEKRARAAVGFAAMHRGPAFAAKIRAKAHKLGFLKGGEKKEKSSSQFYGE